MSGKSNRIVPDKLLSDHYAALTGNQPMLKRIEVKKYGVGSVGWPRRAKWRADARTD
jgi:hypothetical protein